MNGTGLVHQASPIRDAMTRTPPGWTWVRIKNVADVNRSTLPEDTDSDFAFRYVEISSVDGLGHIGELEELVYANAPSRARRLVSSGDSIVSTVRTYLKAIAFIGESATDLVVSTGFATLTPRRDSVRPRFLYWWLRSNPFIEEIVARSVGVSYPGVKPSDVASIGIPLPSLEEQDDIAAFLDSETSHIDQLLAEQQRLLGAPVSTPDGGLVGEHRQALITAAVTGSAKTMGKSA